MAENSYPKVTTKAWTVIRERASSAPSTKFTPDVVAAMMNMSGPDSALRNTVAPMRKLGIIDENGSLTDLGQKWRSDSTYGEACEQILNTLYPEDLAVLVDENSEPDVDRIKTWFEHKGFGASNVDQMTRTYLMLASKKVPEPDRSQNSGPMPRKKGGGAKTRSGKPPAGRPEEETDFDPDAAERAIASHPSPQTGPTVHLDIQIHIPADASSDQIDQIFASMGKHLYHR